MRPVIKTATKCIDFDDHHPEVGYVLTT